MKTNILVIFAYLLFTSGIKANAQQSFIIRGGTVHTGDGRVMENTDLLISNGRIAEIAAGKTIKAEGAEVIDASGKHIYPGLICLNTFMGLNEIDAVRATRDYAEAGQMNPNVRALVAYNTDSKVIPTALFNGILLAQIVPQGGLVSGQSAVVKTQAWNWEDAAIRSSDGIHLSWPEANPWGDAEKQKERMMKELNAIEEFFARAYQYHVTAAHEEVNLRLQSMKPLFTGESRLFIHASSAEAIIRSLNFCKKYPQIRPVLVGADEAHLVVDFIKDQRVPVIVNMMHRLPDHDHDDADLPYKLPALLTKAGIMVAIGHSGSWESRNLMFNAGTAAAYGLTREEALRCITGNAAAICGVDDRTGTIAVGKDATIIISNGDVLDMKSNHITHGWICGEKVSLENTQQQLYKKYMNKYGIE